LAVEVAAGGCAAGSAPRLVAPIGLRTTAQLRDVLPLLGRSSEEARRLADCGQRRFSSRSFVLEEGIRVLAPAFGAVSYRGFQDTLLVAVDELADLTLPSLVSHPAVTRDIGLSRPQLADAVVSVMRASANDGLLAVNTDLGILLATMLRPVEGSEMEHARRFDGIQAGHAGNAGKLLQQYLQFVAGQRETHRCDATLTICVLHSLLTQCAELLKYMQLDSLPDLQDPLTDVPNSLGLTTSVVLEDTFPEPLTGAGLLVHLLTR
jgi:hypothetical protein